MERTPISKFRKMTVNPQWPTSMEIEMLGLQPGTLIFRNLETGEVVAQVSCEDIFDPAGNRFYLDA